jgi:hypothetical protein
MRTKTKTKAAAPPAELTPEQALADAKKAHAARSKEVAANEKALAKAQAARDVAQEAVYAARAVVEGLQAAREKYAVDVAHGRRGAKRPPSAEAASQALAAAEEDLAIAETAVATIEDDLRKSQLWSGSSGVQKAAAAILATSPDVAELVADTQRKMMEFLESARAVEFLRQVGVVPNPLVYLGLSVPVPAEVTNHPATVLLRRLHYANQVLSWPEWDAKTDLAVAWKQRFDDLVRA